jgi:molybdenum cofactor biosynthesis enzyme MoaA
VHGLRRARRAQAADHRRRAAGAPQHHDALPLALAPPATGALEELTVTTNGSQLAKYARELVDCGVRRINVSLDTLDADKFRAITRWGDLDKVMDGLDAAQAAGLQIKINAVALAGVNDAEFPTWCAGRTDAAWTSRSSR